MTVKQHETVNDSPPAWRESLAAVVAVGALAAFLVLVILMFLQRAGSDTAWTRLVYLLTGVEAVAFAGTGWLFGKEVHRAEAQRAEGRIQSEQQRVVRAEKDARQAMETAHTEQLRGARCGPWKPSAPSSRPGPAANGRFRPAAPPRLRSIPSLLLPASCIQSFTRATDPAC